MRAQTAIDQVRTSGEAFNGKNIANPSFREVDKKAWTDHKHPFRVVKADEKLISQRQMPSKFYEKSQSKNKNRNSPEPYTGINDMTLTKKVEDHF